MQYKSKPSIQQDNKSHFVTITNKNDNPKAVVISGRLGHSVVAIQDIRCGEFIAGFYGEIFEAGDALSLPKHVVNHAIQFEENKWRDSVTGGMARNFNHSCSPNCGISGLFDVVAIRDIKAGVELTWDYGMTEDSNWVVPGGKCLCDAKNCRGTILPYRKLSQLDLVRYAKHTSAWLLKKYSGTNFIASNYFKKSP